MDEEESEEVNEEVDEEVNTVNDSGIDKLRWNLNEPLYDSGLEREEFDLINSRFLADGINTKRWPVLIKDCLQLLVPGGWLQMVEPVWAFQSDIGQDLPCLETWWNHYADALRMMEKNARVGRELSVHMGKAHIRGVRMGEANFQNIWSDAQNIPAAGWNPSMPGSPHIFLVVIVRS